MYDTLLYAATHLDNYHFHTDEARALKRELQLWTTLPSEEQEAVAEDSRLLERFRALFPNNPFLEQKVFVPAPGMDDGVSRAITGAGAEGYFDAQGNCLTLHPKGTQQGDDAAVYLSDEAISAFTKVQCGAVEQAQRQFAAQSDRALGQKEQQFSHILRKTTAKAGKTRKSPTLLGVAVCLCLYLKTVHYIFATCHLPQLFRLYGKELFSREDFRPILISAAVFLLAALICIPRCWNTITKGLYRAVIVSRFNKARAEQKNVKQRVLNELKPAVWFEQYAKALRQDRDLLASKPDAFPAQLQTAALLKQPRLTLQGNRFFPKQPWKRYSSTGEQQALVLPVLLIAAMFVVPEILF